MPKAIVVAVGDTPLNPLNDLLKLYLRPNLHYGDV